MFLYNLAELAFTFLPCSWCMVDLKTQNTCMFLTSFLLLTDCCLPVCPPAMLSPFRLPGAVFDRQASVRRSLINTDTVSRRPKKVKRRKTISGVPENVNMELGMDHRGTVLRPVPTLWTSMAPSLIASYNLTQTCLYTDATLNSPAVLH